MSRMFVSIIARTLSTFLIGGFLRVSNVASRFARVVRFSRLSSVEKDAHVLPSRCGISSLVRFKLICDVSFARNPNFIRETAWKSANSTIRAEIERKCCNLCNSKTSERLRVSTFANCTSYTDFDCDTFDKNIHNSKFSFLLFVVYIFTSGI